MSDIAKLLDVPVEGEVPTKAQIEAGWWSEWTVVPPAGFTVASGPEWLPGSHTWEVVLSGEYGEATVSDETSGENATSLVLLGPDSGDATATRHRVAAPVPVHTSDLANDGDGVSPFATVSRLSYAVVEPQDEGGDMFMLQDRAVNMISTSSATIDLVMPEATSGRSRDLFVNLTSTAELDPGLGLTISTMDPASSSPMIFDFGEQSLADAAPGRNLLLFTEVAQNHWLLSVRHEDAS